MAANRTPRYEDEADLVKVSLNLPRSVLRKVEALSKKTGFNKTTVIRRAIDLEAFLDSVTSKDGKILVKQGNDLKEVVFR
jgi:predicted DNA-binding protein